MSTPKKKLKSPEVIRLENENIELRNFIASKEEAIHQLTSKCNSALAGRTSAQAMSDSLNKRCEELGDALLKECLARKELETRLNTVLNSDVDNEELAKEAVADCAFWYEANRKCSKENAELRGELYQCRDQIGRISKALGMVGSQVASTVVDQILVCHNRQKETIGQYMCEAAELQNKLSDRAKMDSLRVCQNTATISPPHDFFYRDLLQRYQDSSMKKPRPGFFRRLFWDWSSIL